jgi:hypothetical protein
LPSLPAPIRFVGSDEAGARLSYAKAEVDALGGYLVAMRAWITIAAGCLEAR